MFCEDLFLTLQKTCVNESDDENPLHIVKANTKMKVQGKKWK